MPRNDIEREPIEDSGQTTSAAGSVDDQGRADEAATSTSGNPPREDRLPPSSHRPDTMVRAVSPEARQEMARDDNFGNQASFTKGANAPTVDQSRYPYTV